MLPSVLLRTVVVTWIPGQATNVTLSASTGANTNAVDISAAASDKKASDAFTKLKHAINYVGR